MNEFAPKKSEKNERALQHVLLFFQAPPSKNGLKTIVAFNVHMRTLLSAGWVMVVCREIATLTKSMHESRSQKLVASHHTALQAGMRPK